MEMLDLPLRFKNTEGSDCRDNSLSDSPTCDSPPSETSFRLEHPTNLFYSLSQCSAKETEPLCRLGGKSFGPA